jgi:hypothetical protein
MLRAVRGFRFREVADQGGDDLTVFDMTLLKFGAALFMPAWISNQE